MAEIGFIGLGQIGMPLAANLVRAGHRVSAFDLQQDRLQEAAAHGIEAASGVARAVEGRPFVITIVPMPRDVESVVLADGGVAASIMPGALYIEMSTIDPLTVRRVGAVIRDKGAAMIDAPVTRSVDMAWEGKSALLVGGEPDDVERAMPVLTAVSALQTHCGPLGNGSAMKLVNNFMAAGILTVVSESLSFGLKSGLALDTIMKATERSGTFNKILLEVLPSRALKGDFSAGFRTGLALKDQRLALDLATAVGSHLALGPKVAELFEEVANSDPDCDFTAILKRQMELDGFVARLDGSGEA